MKKTTKKALRIVAGVATVAAFGHIRPTESLQCEQVLAAGVECMDRVRWCEPWYRTAHTEPQITPFPEPLRHEERAITTSGNIMGASQIFNFLGSTSS